jgi:hypothetical protein
MKLSTGYRVLGTEQWCKLFSLPLEPA